MKQQIIYNEEDIEKFLELTKSEKESDNSTQNFKKLLNVQKKISILSNIKVDDLKQIVDDIQFTPYKYKDVIIKEGSTAKEIFFILSGECQVFVKNKKVGELHAGETFGESAAIFNTKRNAQVVCSKDVTVVLSFCINHDNMDFCAEALATLYKNLAYQIHIKLEDMNKHAR